jgi:hypothetical protein
VTRSKPGDPVKTRHPGLEPGQSPVGFKNTAQNNNKIKNQIDEPFKNKKHTFLSTKSAQNLD